MAVRSSKHRQQYLLRILWRESLRAARGDVKRAAEFLPRIIDALGFRVVVTGSGKANCGYD